MHRLRLALLGSPQLSHAQLGQTVLPNRKALALLAYLAVEAPAAQSRETLLGLLWPELPDAEARNNLRVTWAWLRQRLGDDIPGMPPLLHSTRLDLQLNADVGIWLDLREFHALVHACEQHRHPQRDQCAMCHEQLARAAALYRGDFLSGFVLDRCPEFEAWVFVQRERAHVQVLRLLEELARFHEICGQPSQAETYTRQQLALDPLQEAAHRRLMRLLHHQGHRAAALAQFAVCREVLAVELGIEPEDETAALYLHLKAHIPPAASSTAWSPANGSLPGQLTPFIGREIELAALGERLRTGHERLITLVGPGGIGKTRLAQQVASAYGAEFRDGAYFVPLAQTPSVESIPAAIVEALGLSFAASQRSPVEQLFEILAGRKLLLVLDNLEHLIGGAGLLLRLVQAAPHLVLLVTTRERLNLQAEDLFELDGLPTPASSWEEAAEQFAAVRLFLDRAQRLSKRLPVSAAQLPEIVQICQLVEGFPLAIELAATWTRDLSCQEIVAELSGGLNQLETTLRDIAPHHRSLRAVFDASWRLLSNVEQRALMLLTVFQGGFTRDAAHAVAGVSAALLSSLRDKSLLRPAGARRYDMHAVVQQFTAEALAGDPHTAERAHRDHSRYFLAILAAQAVALDTRDARTAADAIQPDWENVSRAWQWAAEAGDDDLLEPALDGLVRFCNLRGLFQEAQIAVEHALQCSSTSSRAPAPALLHCRLLTARASMAGRQWLNQTLTLAQEALVLAEQIQNSQAIIESLIAQSNACNHIADFVQARALAERALGLALAECSEMSIGMCLGTLGVIDYLTSEFEQARLRFQQVLAIHERTGRLEQFGREAVGRLGIIASEQGRHETALQYLQAYLASCEHMDDRRNVVHAQHHIAFVWLKLGAYSQVIQIVRPNIANARALGDGELASLGLHVMSWAQRALRQLDEALASATEAVQVARASQARLALAFALQQLAEIELERAAGDSDWAQAADRFREAATSFRSIDKTMMAYETEIGLAELHRRRGALAAASALIEPIIPCLPTTTTNGWDDPLRAYLVCVKILHAAADSQAEVLLNQAVTLLDRLAANLSDTTLRQNFLNLSAHREIRTLWDQHGGD